MGKMKNNLKLEIDYEGININNKFILKETSIIVSGILGSILLIGMFFGKNGLIKSGIIIFIILLIVIYMLPKDFPKDF